MAIKRFALRNMGQRLPATCREPDRGFGETHPVVKGALVVAAMTGLMAGGVLAVSDAAPAGASPAGITVNC
jgi:hypothetical protein